MPNPKRLKIQEVAIKADGGNIHLKRPGKASEQVRIANKVSRRLAK